jgi:hypothetical protein
LYLIFTQQWKQFEDLLKSFKFLYPKQYYDIYWWWNITPKWQFKEIRILKRLKRTKQHYCVDNYTSSHFLNPTLLLNQMKFRLNHSMCKQSSFLYSLGGVLVQLYSSLQYNFMNILYFYIIRISEIQDRKIA